MSDGAVTGAQSPVDRGSTSRAVGSLYSLRGVSDLAVGWRSVEGARVRRECSHP